MPTGGGKTLTAVQWLLKNFINNRKKVLWIAHRHELLNQAFKTIVENSYSELLSDHTNFRYRIISGSNEHDRPVNIHATDDIIIAVLKGVAVSPNILKVLGLLSSKALMTLR